MSTLFSKETATDALQLQDKGKLAELDSHELLKADNETDQITSFDEIRELGKLFLSQSFNTVLTSTRPLPDRLLQSHLIKGSDAFWGKLALGADLESQFPVTLEIITTPSGKDLKVHIVPIHFGALQVAQFEQHSDSILALAAAAAVAPHFLLALEGGVRTTDCASKKELITSITPDHGTPLAVTFDAFEHTQRTLKAAIKASGQQQLSIKQAAHLHGQPQPTTTQLAQAAGDSKIAAGVPIQTLLRSELPKHALFIQTNDNGSGEQQIVSINESLWSAHLSSANLPFLAAALGFTSRVVGNSVREQTIEKIFQPENGDMPLAEVLRQ